MQIAPQSLSGFLLLIVFPALLVAAEPSFDAIPSDMTLPVVAGAPQAGKRVRATTPGWETTSVYHTVYTVNGVKLSFSRG